MNKTERASNGVRLPLFLLFGFIVAVAGVVIWLTLTTPDKSVKPDAAPDAPVASQSDPEMAKPDPTAQNPVAERQAAPVPRANSVPEPAPEAGTEPAAAAATTAKPPMTAGPDGSTVNPEAATTPSATQPGSAEKPAEPVKPAAAISSPRPQAADSGVQIARLPPVRSDPPLSPAPAPDLIQNSSLGPLPQTGANGRAPWNVYAKPFNADDPRPRVAIVVTGLGLSAAATESAIQGLPGSVTLAFAPYATGLDDWIRLARAAGHEVLLNVPMEPVNYPAYDPGPQTLLTSLNEQGNLDRLMWILSRGTGYVGIVDFMGSRFTASKPHLSPVLVALQQRGLLYLDSGGATRSAAGHAARDARIPWATSTLTLDERASRVEIDKKFALLEKTARSKKRAIGIASPYPVTLERIATWSRQLVARGIVVAPVSAMVGVDQPAAATP